MILAFKIYGKNLEKLAKLTSNISEILFNDFSFLAIESSTPLKLYQIYG
jgi:hypothetical protein